MSRDNHLLKDNWPELLLLFATILLLLYRSFGYKLFGNEQPEIGFFSISIIALISLHLSYFGIKNKHEIKSAIKNTFDQTRGDYVIQSIKSNIRSPKCMSFSDKIVKDIEEILSALVKGHILLGREDEILFQVNLVDAAKKSVLACHVAISEYDLRKWLKKNTRFSILTSSLTRCSAKDKKRVFVISENLIKDQANHSLLRDVDELSSIKLGFQTSYLAVPENKIDGIIEEGSVDIPNFLYVDSSCLVVIEIANLEPRRWHAYAIETNTVAWDEMSIKINHWLALFEGARPLEEILK